MPIFSFISNGRKRFIVAGSRGEAIARAKNMGMEDVGFLKTQVSQEPSIAYLGFGDKKRNLTEVFATLSSLGKGYRPNTSRNLRSDELEEADVRGPVPYNRDVEEVFNSLPPIQRILAELDTSLRIPIMEGSLVDDAKLWGARKFLDIADFLQKRK